MSYIMLLAAFLLITGIALLWAVPTGKTTGEGYIISVSAVMLLMFLAGWLGAFRLGCIAVSGLGILGWIMYIVYKVMNIGRRRSGKDKRHLLRNPYVYVLAAYFLICIVLYFGDFIQRIDEFHQWAFVVKRMLARDALPFTDALGDHNQYFGTSLFHIYFQKMTGYNEAFMYVSASLLSAIGFLLPFADAKKEDGKKVVLYGILIYTMIFSTYVYGTKNLYVDIPVAAWAGGLAGWWIQRNRDKKVTNLVQLCSGLVMIWFLKSYVGIVMDIILLVFVVVQSYWCDDKTNAADAFASQRRVVIGTFALVGVGILGAAGLLVIPMTRIRILNIFRSYAQASGFAGYKLKGATRALVAAVIGKPLSSASAIPVTCTLMVFLIVVLLLAWAHMAGKKKQGSYYLRYAGFTMLLYMAFLYMAELLIFSYEEALKAAGSQRYLTIPLLYLMVIVLTLLFRKNNAYERIGRWLLLGMTCFFILGINPDYVARQTAFDEKKMAGYEDIKETKEQIAEIKKVIGENDRVFLLNQDGKNEYPTNVAYYYLAEQVSNYLDTPWKFTETGSIIRVREAEEPNIYHLPAWLQQGGYTYLWIYKSDEYLEKHIGKVLNGAEDLADGQLYQVVYDENGNVIRLKLAAELAETEEESQDAQAEESGAA